MAVDRGVGLTEGVNKIREGWKRRDKDSQWVRVPLSVRDTQSEKVCDVLPMIATMEEVRKGGRRFKQAGTGQSPPCPFFSLFSGQARESAGRPAFLPF